MKKKLVVILLVALALTGYVFANGASEDVNEVKVGFIGPMTGDYANYGVMISDGAKLAFEEANAAGGIAGKKIVLIVEDSEGSIEKGQIAIEKLSSSDKVVALLGPVFSSVSNTVAARVDSEGLLMITPSGTNKDITMNRDFVFRTVVSDGLQSKVAGPWFHDVLGINNLAMLYVKNDYSQPLYQGISASFEAAGGKVVAVESGVDGDKDFKTQLTKLKAVNPDAVCIPNYTAEMAQILEQAHQLGLDMQFVSTDGFSNPEIYNLAGAYTDGVYYTGPAQVAESSAYLDFVKNYEAKFGVKPDSFSTNSYDAANVLIAALKKAYEKDGKFDRTTVRDFVAATKDFEGVSGKINFDENGDIVAKQGVYHVNGTEPEYLGSYSVVNGKLQKGE